MTQSAEQIKVILGNTDIINEAKLAQKLHTSQTTLNYQLNHAKKFDTQLRDRIMNVLKSEGVIAATNKDEECIRLNCLTLDLSSDTGIAIAKLQTKIKEALGDNNLNEQEKNNIITHLKNAIEIITSRVNEMLNLLEHTLYE